MQAKKKHRTAYEPNTLTCFLRSIQRYLNDKNSTINIFKDQAFNKAREVLSAKRKEVVGENDHSLLANLPMRKKTNFFVLASLVQAIQKLCNVPYGGFFLSISVFEQWMKVDDSNGVM